MYKMHGIGGVCILVVFVCELFVLGIYYFIKILSVTCTTYVAVFCNLIVLYECS